MASDRTATDTTAIVSGFSGAVATLRASFNAGTAAAPDGTASNVSETPTPTAASVLGKIKIINNDINSLDISPTLELMCLRADLAEVASLYLPQDTRDILDTNGSSDLALEIVARNLTQLPVLAKRLYQVSRR